MTTGTRRLVARGPSLTDLKALHEKGETVLFLHVSGKPFWVKIQGEIDWDFKPNTTYARFDGTIVMGLEKGVGVSGYLNQSESAIFEVIEEVAVA